MTSIVTVGSLVALLGAAAFFVARIWSRLPEAPSRELPALPPATVTTIAAEPACVVCGDPATRRPPTLAEVRGWADWLAGWLPIGTVPTRYRRDVARWLPPAFCDLHAAVADRVLDEFLADEDRAIAGACRARAERAARFQRRDLAGILDRVRAAERKRR